MLQARAPCGSSAWRGVGCEATTVRLAGIGAVRVGCIAGGHSALPIACDGVCADSMIGAVWTLLTKVETSCDRILIAGGANVEAEWEQGPAV